MYARLVFVAIAWAAAVASMEAHAAAQRTFVASTGSDANACSIVAPCRGFAAAVAKTNPGGEVIVLDSAGYGPVAITQSVSIVSPPGIYAGISVFTDDGIVVDGANVAVVVRGLTIIGQGAGRYGINFVQGGRLLVEDCEIANLLVAINATATNGRVVVRNTVLRDSDDGFYADGGVVASLDNIHAISNFDRGVVANTGASITVSNSVLANNEIMGFAVSAFANGSLSDGLITRSTISGSSRGVYVFGASAGATARVVVDATTVNDALTSAFYFDSPASGTSIIYSPTNNTVGFNNGIVIGGTLTPLPQH